MKGGCRFENTGTPFRFRGSNFFPYVKEHICQKHIMCVLYIPNRFDKSKIVFIIEIKNKLHYFFYFFYLVNNWLIILKSRFNLLWHNIKKLLTVFLFEYLKLDSPGGDCWRGAVALPLVAGDRLSTCIGANP